MWRFEQSTGKLRDSDSNVVGFGYSGAAEGKNNPLMQEQHKVGPIPVGLYIIQPPQDTVTHGLYVLPLIAFPENQMFGRYGFLMHGDSIVHPGTASQGCVIQPRDVRELVWRSGDHVLKVISQETI